MKNRIHLGVLLVAGFAGLAGCSGVGDTPSASEVPIVLTVHDAPAVGVSVIAFSVEITGASLQTAMGSSQALVTNTVTVQLASLQTQRELLGTFNVPAGTYSGLMLTFMSANATIFNGSGASITLGGVTCATGATCQYAPTFKQMSSTFSSSPFPITLTAGTPMNLDIDLNLNNSLQSDGTFSPSITATANNVPLSDGNLVDVSSVTGQVTSVGNSQFTLTDSNTGVSRTINVGSSTQFGTFTGCTANNFTCVQKNQLVTMNFGVGADGQTLTAMNIVPFNGFTQGVNGMVVSTNPANNTFNVVLVGQTPAISGAEPGQLITVQPATGATFGIMNGGIAPSGSSFATIGDVLPGQSVFINSTGFTPSNGNANAMFTTDQVQMTPTQLSGNISVLNSPNFTVNGLNSFLTGNGFNQIQVNTGTNTTFQNVSGNSFSGLTTNTNVGLSGLLFGSPSGPVLVGQQVVGPII